MRFRRTSGAPTVGQIRTKQAEMMEMQEIKERKRRAKPVPDTEEDADEVDPSVPLAGGANGGPSARRRSSIEKGFAFVSDRFWPAVFFTIACLGLHEVQFVHEVLYARESNRAFVNLFIWSCTLVVLFGCYIEVYRNLYLGEKVRYENAKTSTHGMLLSMVVAGVCFTIGMWPVWHWMTLPYLFVWFWGVIVQTVVLFPIQIQRVIFAGAYLWFMHSYLSLFVV